jgi:hypothetical protein
MQQESNTASIISSVRATPTHRAFGRTPVPRTNYARPHIGRPEGRPSLHGLAEAGALTPRFDPHAICSKRAPPRSLIPVALNDDWLAYSGSIRLNRRGGRSIP